MVGLYDILFFLFVFGLLSGAVNELGIFEMKVPSSGFTISNSTVTEVQSGAMSQPANDFSAWEVIQSFMRVIGSGITALFAVGLVVYSLLMSVGSPPQIATFAAVAIQGAVTFVTLFGLYEWWTGRSVT
jgi:hypothetical protein